MLKRFEFIGEKGIYAIYDYTLESAFLRIRKIINFLDEPILLFEGR